MRFLFAAISCAAALGLTLSFPFDKSAPSSLPGVIRSDMVLTREQEEYYFGKGAQGRTGITNRDWFWQNETLVYDYVGLTAAEEAEVDRSLREMEAMMCIRYVRRTTETDYVFVTNENTGCWSWIGRVGGAQQLNLGPGCVHDYIIWHEFIHALGFFHMHSAYDRDNFVEIIWENIIPGMEHNFDKVNPETTSQYGVPYDILSVMHYPGWAFTVNGQHTIIPREEGVSIDDDNYYITEKDVARIENMYCPAVCC